MRIYIEQIGGPMGTQSSLKDRLSLDARGGLLIDGKRASNAQLEALMADDAPPSLPSDTPWSSPRLDGSPPAETVQSNVASEGSAARTGFLCLFGAVVACALFLAFSFHTSYSLLRDLAKLQSGLAQAGGDTAPIPTAKDPLFAALLAVVFIVVTGGGVVAAVRWWYQKTTSLLSLVVCCGVSLVAVSIFASALWQWTNFLDYAPASKVVVAALQEKETWAAIFGLGASLAALALFLSAIKAAIGTFRTSPA
jgi:hypothetical protein